MSHTFAHENMRIHQTELEVVRASALDVEADVIVNAANRAMTGGGGIDGAIHFRGGPQMMQELRRIAPDGAQTAEVVVTPGYALPHRFVFHVAGPIWRDFRAAQCDELLTAAFTNALEEADKRELQTLVAPSISTGVYSFPLERAAPLALKSAIGFLQSHPQTTLRRVTFALWGGEEFHVFRRALDKIERGTDHETHS